MLDRHNIGEHQPTGKPSRACTQESTPHTLVHTYMYTRVWPPLTRVRKDVPFLSTLSCLMAIPRLTSNLAWMPAIRVGGGGSPGVPALGQQMVGTHGHRPGLPPARCLESFLGEAMLGHGV